MDEEDEEEDEEEEEEEEVMVVVAAVDVKRMMRLLEDIYAGVFGGIFPAVTDGASRVVVIGMAAAVVLDAAAAAAALLVPYKHSHGQLHVRESA